MANTLNIKIKKLHPDAVIPSYAKPGDAGMDLTAVSKSVDENGNVVYGTGLAFEIPKGYVGLVFPRSSNSKQDLLLSNSVGVIDSGYRGEVTFKFKPALNVRRENTSLSSGRHWIDRDAIASFGHSYVAGDRIGQIIIMPFPQVAFEEVEELSDSERGAGGYGSTGN